MFSSAVPAHCAWLACGPRVCLLIVWKRARARQKFSALYSSARHSRGESAIPNIPGDTDTDLFGTTNGLRLSSQNSLFISPSYYFPPAPARTLRHIHDTTKHTHTIQRMKITPTTSKKKSKQQHVCLEIECM